MLRIVFTPAQPRLTIHDTHLSIGATFSLGSFDGSSKHLS
jgi:hypothetical protein